MKYLAAYCLLALGGNTNVSAADLTNVLKSVEATVDEAAVKQVIAALEGKTLNEVIASGLSKVPALGGGAAPAAASGAAPAAAAAKAPVKEEEPEEEVDFGDGGLFGDDDGY